MLQRALSTRRPARTHRTWCFCFVSVQTRMQICLGLCYCLEFLLWRKMITREGRLLCQARALKQERTVSSRARARAKDVTNQWHWRLLRPVLNGKREMRGGPEAGCCSSNSHAVAQAHLLHVTVSSKKPHMPEEIHAAIWKTWSHAVFLLSLKARKRKKQNKNPQSLKLNCRFPCYETLAFWCCMKWPHRGAFDICTPSPFVPERKKRIFMVIQNTAGRYCHILYRFLTDCVELSYWAEN